MAKRSIINTENAPEAIGTYSQAVKIDDLVYLSGQIPLDPESMQLVAGDFKMQVKQVLKNLAAVCEAAGGSLQDIAKLNVYLTDLENFAAVNDVMSTVFKQPYPARAAVQVAALPKGAVVEIDGIMTL